MLDIAITDRGDAVCGEPFVDRAAGKQRVFAGAPAGMLRRNRLDLARRCRMQGEMRDPGLEALDRLAIARLDRIGLDRQCAAEMVDDRQPGRIEPRHRRGIALAFWRPADHPRQYRHEPIIKGEPHMQIDQFRQHRRRHMRVDMGRLDPGSDGEIDLSAQFGLRRFRHEMGAQARDIAPEIALLVDQPRGAARRRQRPPAVMQPFAGQGQMHAEIERRIGCSGLGDLAKPWARHHDRAATDRALGRELEKGLVSAVAHREVIDMQDDPALDPEPRDEAHAALRGNVAAQSAIAWPISGPESSWMKWLPLTVTSV